MSGRGLRWREDTGVEAQCLTCREWWPLDPEFWHFRSTLSRCRSCIRSYQREYQNHRVIADPTFLDTKRTAARLTAWKDRTNNPAEVAARKRAWYLANRDRVLERQRRKYAEAKAA